MRRQLDKSDVDLSLEALRAVLSHYQQWNISLDMSCEEESAELTKNLEFVRNLRNLFAERTDSSGDLHIDLSQEEENTLVSCLLFSSELLIERLPRGEKAPHALDRLRTEACALFNLSMAFASLPVTLIKTPVGPTRCSTEVATVIKAINAKVQIHPIETIDPLETIETDETYETYATYATESIDTETVAGGMRIQALGVPIDMPGADARRVPIPPPAAIPDRSYGGIEEDNPIGLDLRMIGDARLRSLLSMDLKTLDLAIEANDLRLGAIMLGSVFEAIVADLVLQRAERGQAGSPNSWRIEVIVPQLLGRPNTPRERSALHLLLSCKNLVRPIYQLAHPIEIKSAHLTGLLVFTRAFLHETQMSAVHTTS